MVFFIVCIFTVVINIACRRCSSPTPKRSSKTSSVALPSDLPRKKSRQALRLTGNYFNGTGL
jgi:hypothetical protein